MITLIMRFLFLSFLLVNIFQGYAAEESKEEAHRKEQEAWDTEIKRPKELTITWEKGLTPTEIKKREDEEIRVRPTAPPLTSPEKRVTRYLSEQSAQWDDINTLMKKLGYTVSEARVVENEYNTIDPMERVDWLEKKPLEILSEEWFTAAQLGDLDRMKYLLNGKNLKPLAFLAERLYQQIDEKGKTAFTIAIEKSYKEILQFLSDKYPLYLTEDNPLITAVKANRLDMINFLVTNLHCPINQQNFEGFTPLITAAKKGNDAIVRWLLAHGADVTLTTISGQTAADLAKDPTIRDEITKHREEQKKAAS